VGHRTRLAGLGLSLAAVAALAVACASSSASTPTAAASGPASLAAYTACLSRNGVTLPTGAGGNRTGFPSGRPSGRPSGGAGGGAGTGGGTGGGNRGGFGGFSTEAPAGVDQAAWTKAMAACASVRPTFGGGAAGNNSAFVAYNNCLTEHGVTTTNGANNQLNSADPKVAAAIAACAPLRPTGAPGGPRRSATPAG
jgi:hypothetical protein